MARSIFSPIDKKVHTGMVCSKRIPFHSDFELPGFTRRASVTGKLLSAGNDLVVIGLSSGSGED